jgi:hypothetical protein
MSGFIVKALLFAGICGALHHPAAANATNAGKRRPDAAAYWEARAVGYFRELAKEHSKRVTLEAELAHRDSQGASGCKPSVKLEGGR